MTALSGRDDKSMLHEHQMAEQDSVYSSMNGDKAHPQPHKKSVPNDGHNIKIDDDAVAHPKPLGSLKNKNSVPPSQKAGYSTLNEMSAMTSSI